MATSMKGKLVPKDIGNPKVVTTLPEGQNKHVLGTIIGIASDIFTRTDPQGNTYEGLKGSFEGIPADKTKDTIQSGVLYLPSGIHELVADVIKAVDKDGNRLNGTVQFGFEIAVVKAPNPQGYSWQVTPLIEQGAADPLKLLRDQAMKALPAPAKAEAKK